MTTNNQSRQTWSSRLTYVLTVAGATVGFGATWRFPYLVGENGGGAYVLLFCIAMIVIGIPMILVENVIGRTFCMKTARWACCLVVSSAIPIILCYLILFFISLT